MAPADLPKEGRHYDPPIALGLMAAIGAIPSDALEGYLALGIAALSRDMCIICVEASGPEAA